MSDKEEDTASTDEEVSDDLIVDLIFKSATGSTQSHRLQSGINVIGRGKPTFISDPKISRRHAEIIISSSVTYNQLGQNHSILLRSEKEPIKLTKGVSQTIHNNDSIQLYEGAEPFSIHIEKIGSFTPMSFDDFSQTQQLQDDNILPSPLDYLKGNNDKQQQQQQQQSLTPKRQRDSSILPSTKIINNTTNDNNNDNTIQQEKKQKKSPDSSTVLVQDSLKLSIDEEEFTFVRKIGQGACGEVCQYEWKGTPVAVKVIYKSLLHKDTKGEFEKETEILKCLRHPNVVLFMGTCTLKGNLSIITEYLNRGSLRDVLNNSVLANELDWNTKIKMAIDVAQGMNYLHTYNPKIIHRDLKTLNLLVDTSFNVKVSDFGLSRFVSSSNEIAKTFCGTLPWIAPEVFAGNGYSTQADVFSYGIVLWEILTHKQPQGNTATTALGHPEIPVTCPLPFAELIRECCSKRPEHRPTFQQIIQKLKSMTTLVPSFPPANIGLTSPSNVLQSNTTPGGPGSNEVDLTKWTIALSSLVDVKFLTKDQDGNSILKGKYKDRLVTIKNFTTPITEAEKKQWAVLASVKSPHAVEFIGVVYNKQEHAIISEYMANGSLESLMLNKSSNFTLQSTLNFALQMAESINVLHTHSPVILHRGITSSSFLLDSENNLKITDFGLSRFQIHENMISLAEIKGNYIYSPPELLSQAQFTQKSDVYSFSIVLWELFERFSCKVYKKPFSDIELDYDFQILNHTGKLNKRPTISENVPKEISKLLQQCWDSEPKVRPSFNQILTELKNIKRKLITLNQQ